MRLFINILLAICILNLPGDGQDSNRLQTFEQFKKTALQIKKIKNPPDKLLDLREKLFQELLSISVADREEAKRINAKAVRLFPCCVMEKLTDLSDIYEFSYRSLTDKDVYFAPKISYENNLLKIVKFEGNHGFIIDIGKTAIENSNEQSKEFIALSKYTPPMILSDIKPAFISDNFNFQRNVAINEGNTYLLRAVSYDTGDENIDKIYAVKVQHKETDGSIVLFIKQIKTFDPPKLSKSEKELFWKYLKPNEALVTKVYKALVKRGFKDVKVAITDDHPPSMIILSGTVPKGRIQSMIKSAQQSAGLPVKNEVTEK